MENVVNTNDCSLTSTININTLNTRYCGSCSLTDGMCYTSNPVKCKCIITGQFHNYNDTCDINFDDLQKAYKNLKTPIDSDNKPCSSPKINKHQMIKVYDNTSLLELVNVLVGNDYNFNVRNVDTNESTVATFNYFEVEYWQYK